MSNSEKGKKVVKILKQEYEKAHSSLQSCSPFQFLVAVILSARSTDQQVNRITKELFSYYPDASSLANTTPEELESIIKACGLYRNKSRNLVKLAKLVTDKYGGEIPPSWNEIMQLPGVGRKTANLVWGAIFNNPAFPVDTHVFRVSRRLGLAKGDQVEEVEEELKENIPAEEWLPTHYRLIAHGRKFCLPRVPRCQDCALQSECNYYWNKGGITLDA